MAEALAEPLLQVLPEALIDARLSAASIFATEANHRIANNLTILAGLIRSEIGTLPADALIDRLYISHALEQISVRIDAVGPVLLTVKMSDWAPICAKAPMLRPACL